MDMFTVLTPTGTIICRSRLAEVALSYLTDDTILYVNGKPTSSDLFTLAG